MRPSSIFLLLSSFLSLATATPQATTSAAGAVASPNGLIVPFSTLPACASLCGHLFDVQGACTPPVTSTVSEPCFCGDPRLQPFLDQGTAGVSSVCGPLSCTATADLQAIQSWYETYCNEGQSNPTTTSGAAGATGTSSGSGGAAATAGPVNNSWIATHYRWVIMLAVVAFCFIFGWIGAVMIRKRYIRRKEQIELKPVAWGPHQMQASTNGYNYGDGVTAGSPGGAQKEAGGMVSAASLPSVVGGKRLSKGYFGKGRT